MAKKDEAQQETNAVVPWDAELAKYAQAVAQTEKPSMSSFSLKSGILKYQDVALQDNMIEGIIVGNVYVNEMYEGRFDPETPRSPVCFAMWDPESGGEIAPVDEQCLKKQADVCAGCPKMEWGSDPGGGRGKACKEVRRLGILPIKALGKDSAAEDVVKAEIGILRISVTSVKQWSNYVNELANTMKVPPWAVITRIKVVPDAKSQFKILFTGVARLQEDVARAVHARRAEVTKLLLTPYDKATPEEEVRRSGKF